MEHLTHWSVYKVLLIPVSIFYCSVSYASFEEACESAHGTIVGGVCICFTTGQQILNVWYPGNTCPSLEKISNLSTQELKQLVSTFEHHPSALDTISTRLTTTQLNNLKTEGMLGLYYYDEKTIKLLAPHIHLSNLLEADSDIIKKFNELMPQSSGRSISKKFIENFLTKEYVIIPEQLKAHLAKVVPIIPAEVLAKATTQQKLMVAPYIDGKQLYNLSESDLNLMLSQFTFEQVKNMILNRKSNFHSMQNHESKTDPVLNILAKIKNLKNTNDYIHILENNLLVYTIDDSYNRLAHIAAEKGDVDILKLIKDNWAELKFPLDIFSYRNIKKETPIDIAAQHNQFETLDYFNDLGLFEPWLKTISGKKWIKSSYEKFIASEFGKRYIKKPDFSTQSEWKLWLSTNKGQLWLHSTEGIKYLKDHPEWLSTDDGRRWINELGVWNTDNDKKDTDLKDSISQIRSKHLRSTQNTTCFVISGAFDDHNGAFSEAIFSHKDTTYEKLGGMQCKIADWEELDKLLKVGNRDAPPKDSQILIIQAAHGGPGGNARCNAGDVSGDQILSSLEDYSKRYHVASFIDSCFSGDIMKKKLLNDAKLSDHPRLDKLCIATSSYFGKSSWGNNFANDPLKYAVPGGSFEDLFTKDQPEYGKFDGMLSSAKWTETGITQYLLSQGVKDGFDALSNLQKLLSPSGHCGATTVITACIHPKVKWDQILELYKKGTLPETLNHSIISHQTNQQQNTAAHDSSTDISYIAEGLGKKVDFLANILGEKFFGEEGSPTESTLCNHNNVYSPEQVLRAFLKASINTVNYTDPHDIARRRACREFRFTDMDTTQESKKRPWPREDFQSLRFKYRPPPPL
jgi:hypothetical protein